MYRIKNDVYIRNEKFENEESIFVFTGETNEMYQISIEFLDVINKLEKNNTIEDIVDELTEKYSQSNHNELQQGVEYIIKKLTEIGVIEERGERQ